VSCQTCGRTEEDGGGHWLGCVEALRAHARNLVEPDFSGSIDAAYGETVGQCEVEGCESPKASASARAKYCADHKDPKNRKE
jgi:hypothetical protein